MTYKTLFHREWAVLAYAEPSSPDGIIFSLLICCMLLLISHSHSKCVTNDYMLWVLNPLLLLLWKERKKKLLNMNGTGLSWLIFACSLSNHRALFSYNTKHCSTCEHPSLLRCLGNVNIDGLMFSGPRKEVVTWLGSDLKVPNSWDVPSSYYLEHVKGCLIPLVEWSSNLSGHRIT